MEIHKNVRFKDQKQQQQIKNYLQERVLPILEPLQLDLLAKMPADVTAYCINWIKNYAEPTTKNVQPDTHNDEQPDQIFKARIRSKLKGRRRCRAGISGDTTKETFSIINEQLLSSNKNEWPQQVKINIIMYLRKCVLFQNILSQHLLKITQHMRLLTFKEGDVVIQEGDQGNELYIVDEGNFKCTKQGTSQILKQYSQGEVFGQLALLYNHRRASTITSLGDGKLFALGRQQFNLIVRSSIAQKIKICQQLVSKVDIFQNLNIYERSKLYQSLEIKLVPKQKYIIRQGQIGNCFYIVAEGQLVAYKIENDESKLVYAYKKGDYFGEIALIKHIPRQASIKTLTDSKLIYIDRDTFYRILGPLENILKRNQERYAKMSAQLRQGLH